MSSFSSDQSGAHAAADAQMVPVTQRARVTSIQAEGIANAVVVLKSGGAAGTVIATYKFGTEGLAVYVPGAGILFKDGIVFNLVGAGGSVTVTITGA